MRRLVGWVALRAAWVWYWAAVELQDLGDRLRRPPERPDPQVTYTRVSETSVLVHEGARTYEATTPPPGARETWRGKRG